MIREVFNQIIQSGTAHAQTIEDLNPTPFKDVSQLANSLINRVPYFLGALAFLAIIYSGVLYVLALGDPSKTEMAKKNFTWTIIGVIAISSIYMVIALIVWITSNNPI